MIVKAPLAGAISLRVNPEDILPSTRIPIQDLVANLSARYSFLSVSEIGQVSPLVLATGKLVEETRTLVISQMQLLGSGYVVFSTDTKCADKIVDDLIAYLEVEFGFTIKGNIRRKTYLSSVVVEFDGSKRNILSSLFALENLISSAVGKRAPIKRLAFGDVEVLTDPMDEIERADFLLERRLGSDPHENRFFSTAPLPTDAHLDLLARIEDLSASDAFD